MAEKLLNMINDPANSIEDVEAVEPPEENLKQTIEVEEEPEEEVEEEEEVEKVSLPKAKELFEMEEDLPPKNETPAKKKKRVMSEKQLANLKKAREASHAKRKLLKEAKDLEKAHKKLAREKKKEEILAKKMEQDAMIEMKAKLTMEAQQNATWDENKLEALMEKTIEKYVAKRKADKAPSTRTQLVQPSIIQAPSRNNYQNNTEVQNTTHYVQQTQQPMMYRQNSLPNVRRNLQSGYDENPFSRFMG